MVRVGPFSLELVEAESKKAFKEHTGPAPESRVFAEVEPGVEYFMKVESSYEERVKVQLSVDGVNHHCLFLSRGQQRFGGSLKRVLGGWELRALCFEKAKQVSSSIHLAQSRKTLWTGEVTAEFFKVVRKSDTTTPPPFKTDKAQDNKANEALNREPKVKVFGVKGVFSSVGKDVRDFIPGYHATESCFHEPPICSIKLSYCTAKGLIENKVLSPPLEDTRKRKSTTDACTFGTNASNPFKSTFTLMNELKKVNEQIDEMEGSTDRVLGKELQEKIIDKLKKTKLAIGKQLAQECEGTVENPLEINNSDSE